jgi:histidine ammonia-lyase
VTIEVNASDSNPVVLPGEPSPVSVANYESLPVAASLDHLRLVLASVLTAAGERAVKLLETPWSGLPTGLVDTAQPGPTDATARDPGLAYLGIVVQSLVAEARLLAAPVSLEMASSSHAEGIEDRMTMTPLAARRLAEQVGLGRRIVAIETAVAAQAVDVRAPSRLGGGASALHGLVRSLVPVYHAGEPLPVLAGRAVRLGEPLPGAASTRIAT